MKMNNLFFILSIDVWKKSDWKIVKFVDKKIIFEIEIVEIQSSLKMYLNWICWTMKWFCARTELKLLLKYSIIFQFEFERLVEIKKHRG